MINNPNLYLNFFHNNNNAFMIIKDKKIIDCNDRMVKLFNYKSREDIIDQFNFILFPNNQPNGLSSVVEFHKILNSIDNNCNRTFNFVCVKSNLTEFEAEISISNHRDNNDTFTFVTIRCITDFTYDKKLLESEQFKKYINASSNYFVALDNTGNINFVNKSLGALLANDSNYLIGKNWFDIALPTNIRSKIKSIFNNLMKGFIRENQEIYNQPLLTKSGEKRIVMWSNSILKDECGNIIGTLSSGHDITDKLQIQKQLMEVETNFQQLLENINEIFWVKNINTEDMIYISSAFEHIFGQKWDYKNGIKNFYASVHPADLVNVKASFNKLTEFGSISQLEYRIIKPDNSIRWIYSRAFPVKNKDNKIIRIVGVAEDITERKELQDSLYKMATTDYLTGSYNRQHFLKTSEGFIAYARLTRELVSLLMLDIDYFKKVNDTYGHSIGDEVLKELVKTCTSVLGEKDLFGRIGGEEFSIILTGYNRDEAFKIAEKIRKKVENLTLEIGGYTIRITISIGMSMLENSKCDSDCISNLLNNADKALYQAKNSGRNKTVIF
ncbi:sensor domain-containing diguanylate cyclase [Vallitalea guaymasensis]|uniref:sensor domain-containing diguanylate cyclase n=1 Tax=Vallitalea guaymasensis TaxID=1185412 RepID=UPI00272BB277|nr:diguanylate cyclase [Vallitalea guaymasensis]